MKQSFLLFFVLALTVSVAVAQGGGTPPPVSTAFVPPFTVSLTGGVPIPTNPIIINGDPLVNFTAISFDIKADSEDVKITSFMFGTYIIGPENGAPMMSGLLVYSDDVLLTNDSKFSGKASDLQLSGLLVPALTTKTIVVKFDQISGPGSIQPWIREVQGETAASNTSHGCGTEILGYQMDFVNPDSTKIILQASPELKTSRNPVMYNQYYDTMYVLPGQYWYRYEYYKTAARNYLPNVITVAEIYLYGDDIFDQSRLSIEFPEVRSLMIDPPDPGGKVLIDSSANAIRYQWLSDGSSGISGFKGFSYWGRYQQGNQMPVGKSCEYFTSGQFVLNSSYFSQPQTVFIFSKLTVKSIDGLRGDVDGDSVVTSQDVDILAQRYNSGDAEKAFDNETVNLGRGLVLFSYPNLLDAWLINVWLHNPNDPLVQGLGIGQLMSQRPSLPPTTSTPSLSGKIMTVKTKGFAVNVSTIMPDGKIWSKAERVVNGKAVIEVPDARLHYRVEAASLVSGVTEVSEGLEIPIRFDLNQNYPNPFNPTTTISYSLPKTGLANLTVYNLLGQAVMTLIDGEIASGPHQVTFDASKLTSGVYFYRLSCGDLNQTRKMVLMK